MIKKLHLKSLLLIAALLVGSTSAWADDYELYSGDITEGDYVIYYNEYAMKNAIASNRFENQTVTPSENIIANPDAAIVWHIAKDGNYWTIYNASVEKYAGGKTIKNQGVLLDEVTDYARWTVTKTEDNTYDFENKGRAGGSSDTGNKWLRNNGTNGWACYASSTGGALSLYKKVEATGAATTVTINSTGITNTNKFSGTNAGTLTATVTVTATSAAVAGATVTWSSSKTSVATVDASTGVVTLVGEGSTTIKASYAGQTGVYKSSYAEYVLTVTNENPAAVEIWSENYSSFSANNVPSGGSYNYVCTESGTKIYDDTNAGGETPELLVAKNGGTFSATIPLITSTYCYSGDLTLKYKTNANGLNVKTTTTGITVDGEASTGAGITYSTAGEHKVTFKGVTTTTENITIVFTATTGSNVRIDDIVLKGVQAALTKASTPVITPASGSVASGTEVTITCLTEGVTIYYTTNGDAPTTSSTVYNSASKPTITANTTIKAIAAKEGLTNSDVATATYTIAAPCATPTFSVAAGEVGKGTSVTISTETAGATIYYTTDGTNPTTSSSVYSAAITVNASMTIKAIAAKEGMANSTVASVAYTVRDYVTLPFVWTGGTKAELEAQSGVTTYGLSSDYAEANAPYRLKMDGEGDYIQVKTNEQPIKVLVGVKMFGTTTSKIKVQQSADGSTFSDVEELTISGSSNSTLNLRTTNAFAANTRYVRIYKSVHGSNIGVGPIKITNYEVATISAAGLATFASDYALDFTNVDGLTVYKATQGTDAISLAQVNQVPAGAGVLLRAEGISESTDFNVPVIASAEELTGNLFVRGTGATVSYDNSPYYNYVLSIVNNNIGFYKANNNIVAKDRAYLHTTVAAARLELDGLSGISSVNLNENQNENRYYDLQGRYVAQPTKGLYIVNGRKVVIK